MTQEQLVAIGVILHTGRWQVHSFGRSMAEAFIKELEAQGFTIQPSVLPSGATFHMTTDTQG